MSAEAAAFGVTVVAAVVYLAVEFIDGRRWLRERRRPKSARPRGALHETWPEERVEEAERKWYEMFRGDR